MNIDLVEQTRRRIIQNTKTLEDSIRRHEKPEVYIPMDENATDGKIDELRRSERKESFKRWKETMYHRNT